MMNSRSVCIAVLIAVCAGCGENKNRFAKETERMIADLQDRRATDSLVAYLTSNNIRYQVLAAMALASVQDTTAVEALGTVPLDNYTGTENAAFALGQSNSHRAVKALRRIADSSSLQSEAYEALGKVAAKDDLQLFTSETAPYDGVAWGIYRAGLRGVVDTTSMGIAAAILKHKDAGYMARLGAAHFFARTQLPQTSGLASVLNKAADDENAEIRMAVASALAKVKAEEALPSLARAASDPDYRVRVNAARALRTQPWDAARPLYEKLLGDSIVHVSVAAAEALNQLSGLKDYQTIWDWARKAANWRTQATLYECLCKMPLMAEGLDQEIQDLYTKSRNPYQQAALLMALSNRDNAGFVFKQFNEQGPKVIKSTAASALARINGRNPKDPEKFVDIYKKIVLDGDQGAIIYACGALRDTTLGFKKIITDVSFLEEARSKLSLPKDYETYEPLERTINYFKGLPPPPPLKNEYNHPIDWDLAATIANDQKVIIETTKGKIVMQLFIEEAPGSVVNFVKLVNDKYYDGKFFHRVVPNFVIQTGCDRGDGFGSLDYSIRSEFTNRRYTTGSVGMASAGKDTEGVQWFITHSPTPHLDGRYTIFAEVIEGMEVVHKIEVGDQITSARLME